MIERASTFSFYRESERPEAVSGREFLLGCIERLPECRELPAVIDIGEPIRFIDEAIGEGGIEAQSMRAVLADLRSLEDTYGKEFGASVLLRNGELVLGPYCEGEKESVRIAAPLHATETRTEGGLYIVTMNKMVADVHSHRVDATFSIGDLYQSIGGNNGEIRQSYIVRKNGGIDMVVRTKESNLYARETFEELAELWDVFEGQYNAVAVAHNDPDYLRERNQYIMEVIINTLQLGFYTNHGNEHSSQLRQVIAT